MQFALDGTDLTSLVAALILLGVGWNFLDVESTTMLTRPTLPIERAQQRPGRETTS
jgi:hypothetical protein